MVQAYSKKNVCLYGVLFVEGFQLETYLIVLGWILHSTLCQVCDDETESIDHCCACRYKANSVWVKGDGTSTVSNGQE